MQEKQDAAFACLRSLATAGDEPPERIDTHANVVFIGRDRVYKIKRAVRYSFLDYSTVALRYRYCAFEVVLNRRTAPDLYLGIVPLRRTADGSVTAGELIRCPDPATLPKDGAAAEDWAVVMRRFDDDCLYDRLADRGGLTVRHLQDLGHQIAAFHSAAMPVRKDWGRTKAEVLAGNLSEIARADWLSPEAVADHRRDCETLLGRLAAQLSDRVTGGFIRHCHGDIHLRNIVQIGDRATLFDCIEFSDDFSQIDCLYDLAFLLMDLEHRAMPAAACRVLNRYLEKTGDYGGVGLLAFYTALRAQIRAKIAIATVGFASTGEAADTQRHEAEAYFKLACAAVNRPPPRLIAMGGLSGSGKSTIAQELAERMARDHGPTVLVLRSDAIRKSLWGVAEVEPLPPEAYEPQVSQRVYEVMHGQAEDALRQGVPVILDATHTHPASRRRAATLAERLHVPFGGIWATAPKDVLIERVTARVNDASDADARIVRLQLRQGWGRMEWPEIDTSKRSGSQDALTSSVDSAAALLGIA